jgi:hypothetical protein
MTMSTTPYLLDPTARRPLVTPGINAAFHGSAARSLPFTAWELPHAAIDYCLAAAGVELRDHRQR